MALRNPFRSKSTGDLATVTGKLDAARAAVAAIEQEVRERSLEAVLSDDAAGLMAPIRERLRLAQEAVTTCEDAMSEAQRQEAKAKAQAEAEAEKSRQRAISQHVALVVKAAAGVRYGFAETMKNYRELMRACDRLDSQLSPQEAAHFFGGHALRVLIDRHVELEISRQGAPVIDMPVMPAPKKRPWFDKTDPEAVARDKALANETARERADAFATATRAAENYRWPSVPRNGDQRPEAAHVKLLRYGEAYHAAQPLDVLVKAKLGSIVSFIAGGMSAAARPAPPAPPVNAMDQYHADGDAAVAAHKASSVLSLAASVEAYHRQSQELGIAGPAADAPSWQEDADALLAPLADDAPDVRDLALDELAALTSRDAAPENLEISAAPEAGPEPAPTAAMLGVTALFSGRK